MIQEFYYTDIFPLVSAREIEPMKKKFSVVYKIPTEGIEFEEVCGIYSFKDLILCGKTSHLVLPRFNLIPYVLAESVMSHRNHKKSFAQGILSHIYYSWNKNIYTRIINYDKPVYIFCIMHDKSNYWHIVFDNIVRLVTHIYYIDRPIIVLYKDTTAEYIKQFFDILKNKFPVEFLPYSHRENVLISSEVIVCDPVQKFYFGDSSLALSMYKKSMKKSDHDSITKAVYKNCKIPHNVTIRNNKVNTTFKTNQICIVPSQTSIDIARKIFLSPKKKEPRRSIFSSRKIVNIHKGRFLINENEFLSDHPDYESLDFAKLSIKDQISLMGNTQKFAGLHGAGFANVLFMPDGGHVLELIPKDLFMPTPNLIYFLSNLCHHKHKILFTSSLNKDKNTRYIKQ